MLQTNEIAGWLHRRLLGESRHFTVEDVRIGRSYVAVVLTGGRIGLAARLKEFAGTQIEVPHTRFAESVRRSYWTILYTVRALSNEPWGLPRQTP